MLYTTNIEINSSNFTMEVYKDEVEFRGSTVDVSDIDEFIKLLEYAKEVHKKNFK